jgi:hypothetical protein
VFHPPTIGNTPIAPGLTTHYEYHYDRNALLDSRQLGSRFIALTEAGNLLAFDGNPLQPVREWIDPVPATSLGQDESGAVLVGYRDGRLVRLDGSLTFTTIGKRQGAIAWIGYRRSNPGSSGSPVVLVKRTESRAEIHDLSNSRVHVLEKLPSALLLDATARVWMGADHGEFGGWCRVLDLTTGATRSLTMPGRRSARAEDQWEGVYGFVELPGDEVWAYGGLSHMGFNEGYVIRVDAPERLATFGGFDRSLGQSPTRPNGPVTLIANDPTADGVIVLSYSDVYRADRRLRHWRKIHTLNVHYRWGRPDAVGSYPSVRALHLENGGRTMLLATRVDGYVRVRSGIEAQLAIAGQLGARSIDRIEITRDGPLFIEDDLSEVPWRLDRGAWRTEDLAPPFEPDPREPRMRPPQTGWHETKVLTGPSGDVVTVSESGIMPGTVTTAARRRGVPVVLGRELSNLYLDGTFVTPDGQPWNVWYGEIKRFTSGQWTTVGTYIGSPPDQSGIETGRRLRPLPFGPPWIILDLDQSQLLTLTPDAGSGKAQLAHRPVTDPVGRARRVLDAIPWSEGELLLATDSGLALYSVPSGRLVDAPISPPPRAVSRLYLDRKNRLWLGGQGLWMLEDRGRTLRSFDALPMIGGSTVEVIAEDPESDGVVVSLGERGIVRLRLGPH